MQRTLAGGRWHNAFPVPLKDTGHKVPGWPRWRRRTLYEYTAARAPMTFFYMGVFIRPDRHGFTDLGSVPELLQLIVPKDLHCPSFILHDSACREHALYFAHRLDGPYEQRRVHSDDAARFLGAGLYAAGFTCRARLVERLVARFGPHF